MPPAAHYSARLAEIASSTLAVQSRSVEINRLLWLLGAVLLIVAYFVARHRLPFWTPCLPAAFAAVLWNSRSKLQRQIYRLDRLSRFYARGLARLRCDWNGAGDDGSAFQDKDHLYAADLDLFGHGSLFQLMNTARSSAGQARLAHWMLHPATPDDVLARHAAIRDLKGRIGLREAIALAGSSGTNNYTASTFAEWLSTPQRKFPAHSRALAMLCIAITLAVIPLLAVASVIPISSLPIIWMVALCAQGALAWSLAVPVGRVIHDSRAIAPESPILISIARLLASEKFAAPALRVLQRTAIESLAPLSRLQRRLTLVEKRETDAFMPFCYLTMWGTQFAIAIEEWRQTYGPALTGWLDSIASFEALNAIACYAYEHPEDPLPEFSQESAEFAATRLAHPLIPSDRAVGNDFALNAANQFLLVSGSNMSGKSTFLRAIGLNTVLAWMGAPVRAQRLRISPLTLGTSIQIQDSLIIGASRFLAEMTRLRDLLRAASGRVPLLFLIDEVMSGTNSRDRRIAAEVVIRRLLAAGAIGIVTTHDLTLTTIPECVGSTAKNVHFTDDGMEFDFKLKSGACTGSNGLRILEQLGIATT
jgi:hypothetical protein